MRTTALILAGATVVVALSGCQKKSVEAGQEIDLSSSESIAGTLVDRDTVADVTFTFGDKKVNTTEVARIFESDSSEVYLSLRVYALKEFPAINNVIAQKIDSVYNYLTMDSVAIPEVASIPQMSEAFEMLGHNFTDSVAPKYYDAVVAAFNIAMDFRPVYAYKDYLTYSSYMAYFLGGAHADYDFYYTTFDPVTGTTLGFDDLIVADRRADVRKALVETMAKSNNQTVEEYLKGVNDFVMNKPDALYTVDNFPIIHVGLGEQGLVFSYPKYSIAPGVDGCPTYVLPMRSIKDCLAI